MQMYSGKVRVPFNMANIHEHRAERKGPCAGCSSGPVRYTFGFFVNETVLDDLDSTEGEIACFLRFASSGGLGSQLVSTESSSVTLGAGRFRNS